MFESVYDLSISMICKQIILVNFELFTLNHLIQFVYLIMQHIGQSITGTSRHHHDMTSDV